MNDCLWCNIVCEGTDCSNCDKKININSKFPRVDILHNIKVDTNLHRRFFYVLCTDDKLFCVLTH